MPPERRVLGIKLSAEEYALIEELAAQQGLKPAQLVRQLLADHAAAHDRQWPDDVGQHGGKRPGAGRPSGDDD